MILLGVWWIFLGTAEHFSSKHMYYWVEMITLILENLLSRPNTQLIFSLYHTSVVAVTENYSQWLNLCWIMRLYSVSKEQLMQDYPVRINLEHRALWNFHYHQCFWLKSFVELLRKFGFFLKKIAASGKDTAYHKRCSTTSLS